MCKLKTKSALDVNNLIRRQRIILPIIFRIILFWDDPKVIWGPALFAGASKCLGIWFIPFGQIRSNLTPSRITPTKGSSYSICSALFLESSYVMTITNYVIMTQLRIYEILTGWLGGAGGFLGNIFWIELIQLFWSVGSRAINKRSTAWSWSKVALHFGIFEWSFFAFKLSLGQNQKNFQKYFMVNIEHIPRPCDIYEF